MSLVDGPLQATDSFSPEASSSAYTWTITTKGDTMRIMTERSVPTSTSTGEKGEFCWGHETVLGITTYYFYLCVATDTWKRSAFANLPI